MDANMVEIDVQQLKDGILMVLHDMNFKRTTGVDLNVWDKPLMVQYILNTLDENYLKEDIADIFLLIFRK